MIRTTAQPRYLLLLATGMLFFTTLTAQQKPQYTQYVINNYIINPAVTGIENYTDIKLGHRQQWVGIKDAPMTSYITIHTPLGKQDYKTNATTIFTIPGDNPRGKDYWENYTASAPHHGIGLQILNDRSGPFNNFSVLGTYAYHIGIGARTNLSAGIGVGASKLSLNTSKLFFGTDYPIDPAVYGSGVLGKTQLDMNAGLWLYSANYFAGFSVMQLIPQKIDFSGDVVKLAKGKLVPHFFATAGYRFLVSDDVNLLPSVMVKSIAPVPIQVDFNMKALYRDAVWFGGNYRGKYGFSAYAGFKALNFFMLSYSYDYSTTKIHTVSSGTHEIIIGFILGNKYSDDTCPRNLW